MQFEMLDPQGAWLVHDFMPPAECRACIVTSEANQYGPAPLTRPEGPVLAPDVRNNSRVTMTDPALADSMWRRLKDFVPPSMLDWSGQERRAVGVHERLRYLRYDAGERFARHFDGTVAKGEEASLLTLLVYLNDGFEGGQTIFYTDHEELKFVVRPRRGTALLFLHNMCHEGAWVLSGRKYVLRSEVLFSGS